MAVTPNDLYVKLAGISGGLTSITEALAKNPRVDVPPIELPPLLLDEQAASRLVSLEEALNRLSVQLTQTNLAPAAQPLEPLLQLLQQLQRMIEGLPREITKGLNIRVSSGGRSGSSGGGTGVDPVGLKSPAGTAVDLPTSLHGGGVRTSDSYTDDEYLADQAGSATDTLTFSFTSEVDLIWARSSAAARAVAADSPSPSATLGIVLAADEPTPITRYTDTLKVYLEADSTVKVWGYRYA